MNFRIVLPTILLVTVLCYCNKPHIPHPGSSYSADIANAWMQLHITLTKTTPGYNSIVSDRSFGYAGITLYESIAPSVAGAGSLLSRIGGTPVPAGKRPDQYYWPASLNAAMAQLTKDFFPTTSDANKTSIDSLEKAWNEKFKKSAADQIIQNAIVYGRAVAASIFEWSKTDGGHEAYIHLNDPNYTVPSDSGHWIPTPSAKAPPLLPHWGGNRSFIANIANATQPGAPTAFSGQPGTPFYNMVKELYDITLSLSHEDSIIVKFWGDQPGNLNVPAHATSILMQLVQRKKMSLQEAAYAYALHGIAMNDASISTFKTKYTYTLIRPISYIQNVFMDGGWNSVIPTPPHPEYSAAHAVISAASAAVLEKIFGTDYAFSDNTYASSYGVRTYASFDAYAKEAGHSRLMGGLHYGPSIDTGLVQGRKIGKLVNGLSAKLN